MNTMNMKQWWHRISPHLVESDLKYRKIPMILLGKSPQTEYNQIFTV